MAKVWTSDGPEDERIDLMNPGHAPVHALARTLTFADVAPVVQPGQVLGLQIDEVNPGPAVPLTGLEVGELVRFHSRQTFTTAGVDVTIVLNPDTNVLEKTSGANVSIAALTGGDPGRIVLIQHRSGGGTTTTLRHDIGGTDGFLCPNNQDFVFGGSTASGGIQLNQAILHYDPNQDRWLVFPRGLTGPELRGTNLTVSPLGTINFRPRPRYLNLQDFFLSGNAASGTVGSLGWFVLGTGAPTVTRNDGTALGSTNRITLATSGAPNERASLVLGDIEARAILTPADLRIAQLAFNPSAALTSSRRFFGLSSTFATEPATVANALGIYYDSAVSANYQIIARSGGVGAPVDTGVPLASNTPVLITIDQLTTGSYAFHVNDTLVGTIAAGVPTAALNFGVRVETLTAASRNLTLGYIGLQGFAGGAFDNDDFLES